MQDGWTSPIGNMTAIVSPKMVEIADPMSKGCQQHGPLGEATLHPERWDCAGCKWMNEAAGDMEAPMGPNAELTGGAKRRPG